MNRREREQLLQTLEQRFAKHPQRHSGIAWASVLERLEAKPAALQTLKAMQATGGEPDVIGHERSTDRMLACDCSPESPSGRRSLCFDRDAWAARKADRPTGNDVDMAAGIGVELLSEAQYAELQRLGEFDLKTSSWLATPADVRERGGALFGDRRYDRVFVYHNGAQSYYAARGFRGLLRF